MRLWRPVSKYKIHSKGKKQMSTPKEHVHITFLIPWIVFVDILGFQNITLCCKTPCKTTFIFFLSKRCWFSLLLFCCKNITYEKVYLWHWQKVIGTYGFIEENWQFPTSKIKVFIDVLQSFDGLFCEQEKFVCQMCGQLWAIFVKERRASLVPLYLHPYPSQAAHCSGFRIRLLQLTFTYHIQWLTKKKSYK